MTTESDTPTAGGGFAELGLRAELVRAVEQLGYEEPTRIQREAVPALLAGRDLLGLAATGTGKTAAFALPMLHGLQPSETGRPTGLILVPTRELAIQVAEAVHRYGRDLGVRVLPVYGGSSMGQQLRSLRRGVDVVVATPGRALDHLNRETLKLDDVRFVVLDEADEMLDMGFQEDLEAILGATPAEKQMALFSATFPRRLRDIAGAAMRDPVRIEVDRTDAAAAGDVPRIRQLVFVVRRHDKRAALCRVLDMEGPKAALVFCRTRIEVEDLTEALQSRGYGAEALHGGLTQQQRDRSMGRLRSGAADVIVATDVAARGIDIEHLTHVVNYDAPPSPEQYTHRIGRTGRAGREGTAITLLEPRERRLAHRIEQLTGQKVESAHVPSADALRARRLNVLQEQVKEAAASPGLEPFRAVCDSLAGELEPLDIAAAALRALHRSSWNDDLVEIPSYSVEQPPHAKREKRRAADDRRPARDKSPAADGNWTRLFIGLGRKARLRAGDIVGAILNETSLPKEVIGRIEIAFSVSFVEVRAEVADDVIAALRRTSLRGRRVNVRHDRGPTRR